MKSKNKKFISTILMMLLLFVTVIGGTGCGGGGSNSNLTNNDPDSISQTTYTVTFDSNGGSDIESQTVFAGKTATHPGDPIKDNNSFMGWYSAQGFSFLYDFASPVNRDITIYAKWYDENDTTDTDGDGLPDSLELTFGTDPTLPDTDGDGLTDYEELNTLNYNPLVKDTNGDGINDGDEDQDGDGLTNLEENDYGTKMIASDTDHDDLTDYEEVITYGTNPLIADTDGDGVDDGTEIAIGSNPLIAETSFETKLGTSMIAEGDNEAVDILVTMKSGADTAGMLHVIPATRADNILISNQIPGYLNAAYEINANGSFDSAVVEFTLGENIGTINANFQPRIYFLNEKSGLLEELENQVVKDGKITAQVSHFSIYVLLNKIEFDAVWINNIRELLISSNEPMGDSNNDGISDFYTKLINDGILKLSNGTSHLVGVTDMYGNSDDWDGDGLKNGEEIIIASEGNKVFISMKSDPLLWDTDFDGYSDYEEVKNMNTSPLKFTFLGFNGDMKKVKDDASFSNIFKYIDFSRESHKMQYVFDWNRWDEAHNALIDYIYKYTNSNALEKNEQLIALQLVYERVADLLGNASEIMGAYKAVTNCADTIHTLGFSDITIASNASRANNIAKKNLTNLTEAKKLDLATLNIWLKDLAKKVEPIDKVLNTSSTKEFCKVESVLNGIGKDVANIDAIGDFISMVNANEWSKMDLNKSVKNLSDIVKDGTRLVSSAANITTNSVRFFKLVATHNKYVKDWPVVFKSDRLRDFTTRSRVVESKTNVGKAAALNFTLIIDGITMAKDVAKVIATYSKVGANIAAYQEYLALLRHIEKNLDYPDYVRSGAQRITVIFNDAGDPDWNKFNLEVGKAVGTKIVWGAAQMAIDIASNAFPFVKLVNTTYKLTKIASSLLGITERAKTIVEAQVYYSITNESSHMLDEIVDYESIYFSVNDSAEKDEAIKYLIQLAQSRIIGLYTVMLYIIDGGAAGWIDRGSPPWPLGIYEDEQKRENINIAYLSAIEEIYKAAKKWNLELSAQLPFFSTYGYTATKDKYHPEDVSIPIKHISYDNVPVVVNLPIDDEHFPDEGFRSCLSEKFDTNGDGKLSISEIDKITTIDLRTNKRISSLKGIEYLTKLRYLDCRGHNITSIDVSKNTLTDFYCDSNIVEIICHDGDLPIDRVHFPDDNFRKEIVSVNGGNYIFAASKGGTSSIVDLYVSHKDISTLKGIEYFTNLQELECQGNKLVSLDLTQNIKLQYLYCSSNQLEKLNLNNNIELKYLDCVGNNISKLNVSNNKLIELYCDIDVAEIICRDGEIPIDIIHFPDKRFREYILTYLNNDNHIFIPTVNNLNSITSMDVSHKYISSLKGIEYFVGLQKLECYSNNLDVLDLTQNIALQYLSCWGNNITSLDVSNNRLTELYCDTKVVEIFCPKGDLPIDSLHFPDDNFRRCIVGINENNYIFAALNHGTSEIKDIQVNGGSDDSLKILSLKGIEYFTELKYLSCQNNKLSQLDLSNNTKLQELNCKDNNITFLDISQNKLTKLYCDLKVMEIVSPKGDIPIDSIRFPDENFRKEILKNNDYNFIFATSKGGTGIIKELNVNNADISSLKGIEYFTELEKLECRNNNLTQLDLTKNVKLIYLDCTGNKITSLNLYFNNNLNLTELYCDNNVEIIFPKGGIPIDSIRFPDEKFRNYVIRELNEGNHLLSASLLSAIDEINVFSQDISSLKGIEYFTELKYLECQKNKLAELDLSKNTKLEYLDCSHNDLKELNLDSNIAIEELYCSYNELTSLDLTYNLKLKEIDCRYNQIIELTLGSKEVLEELRCYNNKIIELDISSCDLLNEDTMMYDDNVFIVKQIPPDEEAIPIDSRYFPDKKFRYFVVFTDFDTDRDMKLSLNERADKNTLYDIRIRGECLSLQGIEFFTELHDLDCSNNKLASLDLSKNTKIEYLNCSNNNLVLLNLSKNTELQSINCSANELIELNIDQCSELWYLDCTGNNIDKLYVGGCPALVIPSSNVKIDTTTEIVYERISEESVTITEAELVSKSESHIQETISETKIVSMKKNIPELSKDLKHNYSEKVVNKAHPFSKATIKFENITEHSSSSSFNTNQGTDSTMVIAVLTDFIAEETCEYIFEEISFDKIAHKGSTLIFIDKVNESADLQGVFLNDDNEEITMPLKEELDHVKIAAAFEAGKAYSPVVIAKSDVDVDDEGYSGGGCNSTLLGALGLFTLSFFLSTLKKKVCSLKKHSF